MHCASWNNACKDLVLTTLQNFNGNKRDLLCRLLGYGLINANNVIACTERRVTLIGYGSLLAEEGHMYKLPLPYQISGQVYWRKLSTTLAWISPINPVNQKYRSSALFFDFPNRGFTQLLQVARSHYDDATVKRGTVQHEIFEGSRATVFPALSSLDIRVNCKADAGSFQDRIRYGLAVTLEIDETIEGEIDIYNEIKQRIQPQIVQTV